MFATSRTKERDRKLSNIKLALSKYNAKYVRSSSTTVHEDSDDNGDDDDSKTELTPRLGLGASVKNHDTSNLSDIKGVEHYNSEKDETLNSLVGQMDEQGLPANTSLDQNLECNDGVEDNSSLSVEENPLLQTASSMDSIHTDSTLGLNNIHSVSSLAESVIPLNEVDGKEGKDNVSSTNVVPYAHNAHVSQSSTSSFCSSSSHVNGEGNSDDRSTIFHLNSPFHESDEKTLISPLQKKLNQEISESKSANIKSRKIKNSCSTRTSYESALKISDFAPERNLQQCPCKCYKKNERKSVAVQTIKILSTAIEPSARNKICDCKSYKSVPIIKPIKLPSYVKHNPKIASVSKNKPTTLSFKQSSNEQKGDSCIIEDEISGLVAHHLQLTMEFLERQHRMYKANCKAVQYLEQAYRGNALPCNESQFEK